MSEILRLPQSWYPVCLSSEIRAGKHIAIELFGKEWILFRGHNNVLSLLNRYCPHMGTDLTNGTVKDSCIVCPLHNWRFNTAGIRTNVLGSNHSPEIINIEKLSVEEYCGVVFVFCGEKPLFALPLFTGLNNPIYSKPVAINLDNNYLAITLNGFDTSHLYSVHNRNVDPDYELYSNSLFHLGISLTVRIIATRLHDHIMKLMGFGKSDVRVDCWGGNYLLVSNTTTRHKFLMALAPGKEYSECRVFVVVADESKANNITTKFIENVRLYMLRYLSLLFFRPDIPVIKNMRPVRGALSEEKDRAVITFWEYMDKLPFLNLPKEGRE